MAWDLTSYGEPVHVIQEVNGGENEHGEVLVKRLCSHQTHFSCLCSSIFNFTFQLIRQVDSTVN